MRKTALVFGLLAAVAAWPAAHAAVTTYKANLSGASEVPPVAGGGSGTAQVSVDSATKEISWRVDYSGMSGPVAAAHIHCGALPGANAGVAVPLGAAPNLASPITGEGSPDRRADGRPDRGQVLRQPAHRRQQGRRGRGQLAQ